MAVFEGARRTGGGVAEVDAGAVAARLQDVVLVDVREAQEWAQGHVAQAVLTPMSGFPAVASGIPKDRPVVVMCHSGARSARVAAFLSSNGVTEVYNLRGGILAWSAAGLPVTR